MPHAHPADSPRPPPDPPPPRDWLSKVFGSGGLGVGLALVVVPAALLMLGLACKWFDGMRLVGLPMLAIFGIIILFGTLALVAMLFQSLGLTNRDEALALPQGSIRAAIALSLIVLFAIIATMLFQSMLGSSYLLQGLNKAQRDAMVDKSVERVIDVVPAACAASVPPGGACAEADQRFDLRMQGAKAPEGASDLAKQLLVLVGTLMTSVTSFYFASRGQAEAASNKASAAAEDGAGKGKPGSADKSPDDAEAHVDGCDVAITDPTADADLPVARGGVAPAVRGG